MSARVQWRTHTVIYHNNMPHNRFPVVGDPCVGPSSAYLSLPRTYCDILQKGLWDE